MKEKRNQTLFVMSLYCFYLSFLKNKSLFNIFLTFFSVVRYFSISFIYTFIHLSKKCLTFLNLFFLLKKTFLIKKQREQLLFLSFWKLQIHHDNVWFLFSIFQTKFFFLLCSKAKHNKLIVYFFVKKFFSCS